MKLENHPQELTQVPFSKTECGVDFNINTDTHERLRGVLMEYPSFKTNFFELFFFRKASGWLRYGFQHIALKDNTVLILSPHIHQEWHIDESQMDYRFLVSVMIFFQPILPILSLLIVCFIATKQIFHPICRLLLWNNKNTSVCLYG